MFTIKRKIYIGLLATLLSLACSLSFVACTEDYEEQVIGSETVATRLSVKANSMGGVSVTRAYNEDENAEEGEFIHSLCVYVVEKDGGNIVKKYCTDDDTDENSIFTEEEQKLAENGNLGEWTSGEYLKLDADKSYIVYAFANWETTWAPYFDTTMWDFVGAIDDDDALQNQPWYKLINKSVGETITEDDIDFSVDHPAEKIDIDNKFGGGAQYIPMSGRAEITGGKPTTVELVRLVAKVEMTMKMDISTLSSSDDESNYYYPLQWAMLGYFAERVPLFEGGKVHEYMPHWDYVGWPNVFFDNYYPIAFIPINSSEPYSIDKRYVNETNLDNIPSDIYYYYPGFYSEWMFYTISEGGYEETYYNSLHLHCYSTIREFKRNDFWTLEHTYTGSELILTDVINWGVHGEEILDVYEIEDDGEGN